MTTNEKRIQLFIKGLNSELQVLSVHITTIGKHFNEVIDFVKKVKTLRKVGYRIVSRTRPLKPLLLAPYFWGAPFS